MVTLLHVVRPDMLPAASSRLADRDRACPDRRVRSGPADLILTTISSTSPYGHAGLTHGSHIRHDHIQDNAFHIDAKVRHHSVPGHDDQES